MNLKRKENKWLYAFIAACVLLVAAVVVAVIFATRQTPAAQQQPNEYHEGAEVGIYYYDMVNGPNARNNA